MARNKKIEVQGYDSDRNKVVLHPITTGDNVFFEDGETLNHKLSNDENVMYSPEVTNSSPMFKVGEGDTTDYSDATLDGVYKSAILKGQTYVNYIQEPSSDSVVLPTPFDEYTGIKTKTFTEMNSGTFGINLQGQSYVNLLQDPSKENYVILGENLETSGMNGARYEYTTEGNIKSALAKGVTLVNVDSYFNRVNDFISSNNIDSITAEGYIQLTAKDGTWRNAFTKYKGNMKPSTKYLIVLDIKENTLNGAFSIISGIGTSATDKPIFGTKGTYEKRIPAGTTGIFKNICTTIDDLSGCDIVLRNFVTNTSTTGKIVYRTMVIEYREGMENWDIPFFQGMQSVTMNTTLTNKITSQIPFRIGTDNDFRDFTITGGIKANTKYLLRATVTGAERYTIGILKGQNTWNTTASWYATGIDSTKTYTLQAVVQTTSNVQDGLRVRHDDGASANHSIAVSNVMMIEYQNGIENWNLPFIKDEYTVKPIGIRTTNQNLFDGVFMNKSINTTTGADESSTEYTSSENYIAVKPNTMYKLITTKEDGTVLSKDGRFFMYDADKRYIGESLASATDFTGTTANTRFLRFRIPSGEYVQAHLVEGTEVVDYVTPQQHTTKVAEPVVLRSLPNGVCDTLDLSTGKYVQRVGEICFDGEGVTWYSNPDSTNANLGMYGFVTDYGDTKLGINRKQHGGTFCDKLPILSSVVGFGVYNGVGINIIVNDCTTSAQFNEKLRANPITIQYELETPITTYVTLEYPQLQTYNDVTHVISVASSGTLTPNIYLPKNIEYPSILKANTKYNLYLNHNTTVEDTPLMVNVGGMEVEAHKGYNLITTPTELTSSTVSFSGKGNDIGQVMLIENSTLMTEGIEHFEGIGSVELGKYVENLCEGRVDEVAGSSTKTESHSAHKVVINITSNGSKVACFNFTKPLVVGKKYFVYAPFSCNNARSLAIGFKRAFYDAGSPTLYSAQVDRVHYTNNPTRTIFTIEETPFPYEALTIGNHGDLKSGDVLTLTRPIFCEYVNGMENWDWESIGYFTGTKQIGKEFMRIQNKNLFDGILESGRYTKNEGAPFADSSAVRTKNRIKVKPSTSYVVSNSANAKLYNVSEYDKEGNYIGVIENVSATVRFTTNSRTRELNLSFSSTDLQLPVQLEESTSATSYVAHKRNTLATLPNQPLSLTWSQGVIDVGNTTITDKTWANVTNNAIANRIRTQLLDLKPNTTYRLSLGYGAMKYSYAMFDNNNVYNKEFCVWSNEDKYITTTPSSHKIAIHIRKDDDTNITPTVITCFSIEEVTDIQLRSLPNGVCDELDVTRGVYIQRVGKIALDGSDDENYSCFGLDDGTVNTKAFSLPKTIAPFVMNKDGILCDKIIASSDNTVYKKDYPCVAINQHEDHHLQIRVLTENGVDLTVFREYLKNNPITILGELLYPIEHKVNLAFKNESNQSIKKPNGNIALPLMNEGINHVTLDSTVYGAVQSRDYIAYPVAIASSRQYTVFHNKIGSTDLTVDLCGANPIAYNMSGKTLVTTGSSLTHNELRLSGKGNKVANVTVIEGDLSNIDVPYLEGIKNAVNPIVKNVGKNLLDYKIKHGESWWNGAIQNNPDSLKCKRSTELIPVKPNATYVFSSDQGRGFNVAEHGKDKKFIRNGSWVLWGKTYTVPSDCYYIHWFTDDDDATYIQMEEAMTISTYEPYKSNTCSVDCGVLIIDKDDFEQGGVTGGVGTSYEDLKYNDDNTKYYQRIRNKQVVNVKPNTTYYVDYSSFNVAFNIYLYDIEDKLVQAIGYFDPKKSSTGEVKFTTPSNTYGMALLCSYPNANLTLSPKDVQGELKFYALDETVPLRSLPNGVCDEIDLETGIYIQRVGEVVLDGSQAIVSQTSDDESYLRVSTVFDDIKIQGALINDKLPCERRVTSETTGEFVGSHVNSTHVHIRILSSRLDERSIPGVIKYLQANPITVQYELATPIIKEINIRNYPHSYQNGHVVMENDYSTPITAQLTYKTVTNRSGQIEQHTKQIQKQEQQINELENLVLASLERKNN